MRLAHTNIVQFLIGLNFKVPVAALDALHSLVSGVPVFR